MKRLKLSTPTEVRKALNRIANMILNGQIDPKSANAIIYACNVVLGAIRTDEQEKRLDELEKLINESVRKRLIVLFLELKTPATDFPNRLQR